MEKEIIIDNVLCYVSTARHTLKNDDILQTCLAFYKEEEIIKAKDLFVISLVKNPKGEGMKIVF